jgi:hypothetical protein
VLELGKSKIRSLVVSRRKKGATPKNWGQKIEVRSCNNTSCLANLLQREEELIFNSVAVTPLVPKSFALTHFNK